MTKQQQPTTREAAEAWNYHRTLCIAGKEIQKFRERWQVYTPTAIGYDFDAATDEYDTLEQAICAACAVSK